MRILFLAKYGPLAASSRYRFLQYIPALQQLGFECDVLPLLEDDYLAARFQHGIGTITSVVRGYIKRLSALCRAKQYDLIVLNYEFFPYLPSFFEKYMLTRQIPYLYDFDDAVFHTYDQHPNRLIRKLLSGKIKTVIQGAACVIAGNPYLMEYALAVNKNVHLLPTVIDLERYAVRSAARAPGNPFTVGWIGSPSTAAYVQAIEPALDAFCERRHARLVLVGFGKRCKLSMRAAEVRPWSEANEVEEIRQFDVGIMPVSDTLFARGKCGFKLIQYLACGIPVIATPIGVNSEIVEHGVNGFLANDISEWTQALEALYANETLRRTMGEAGRKKVERHYCLQVTGSRFTSLLEQTYESTRTIRKRRVVRPNASTYVSSTSKV